MRFLKRFRGRPYRLAIVGTCGLPPVYGGFETLVGPLKFQTRRTQGEDHKYPQLQVDKGDLEISLENA